MMRFVTLFPECPEYGLYKDVGQLAYSFAKYYGYQSTLVTAYQFYNPYSDYLNIETVSASHYDYLIKGCRYIWKKAKNIDILNLYHSRRRNIFWAKIYKFKNPNGILYLKLDMSLETLDTIIQNKKSRKRFLALIKNTDVISVESRKIQKKLKRITEKEIYYLPNGTNYESVDIGQKKNIIFTSGRIGTDQKATDVLLEAFAKSAKNHVYSLYLAGGIEKEFERKISEYFIRYPQLRKRVVFLGMIKERDKLKKLYEEAKIFIMTSRWEGFPLVLPEALICGCYCILTDSIPPAQDIIENIGFGTICKTDDVNQIGNAISDVCNMKIDDVMCKKIAQKAEKIYTWRKIAEIANKIFIEEYKSKKANNI